MKLFTLLFCTLITLYAQAAEMSWYTDYAKAEQLSQTEQKPLLLFFNGSDWSGEAMKMKSEVLSTPHFFELVTDTFICVEIDSPRHTAQESALTEQNSVLKEKYQIQECPQLVVIDPQGREISRCGYLPEKADQLAADLIKMVEQDHILAQAVAKLDQLTGDELIEVYEIAQELQRSDLYEIILERGVHQPEPHFFALEKYRLLVSLGRAQEEETLKLKKELFALDPQNIIGFHFATALIDFQSLANAGTEQDPHQIITPLQNYLTEFSESDENNIWRVEMMIAQCFVDGDEWQEALEHAEVAYEHAPTVMRPEIENSLNYIRSQTSSD